MANDSVTPLQDAFSIPMRGNETSQDRIPTLSVYRFSIPMRGNEARQLMAREPGEPEFSIPMRGNEERGCFTFTPLIL